LVVARLCQGARIAAIDTRPPEDASLNPEAAAAAFSLIMRRYSAGEHLFCAISNVRRAIVSQDANISSVIVSGSDDLRRLLALIPNMSPSNLPWREFDGCRDLDTVEAKFDPVSGHADDMDIGVVKMNSSAPFCLRTLSRGRTRRRASHTRATFLGVL
jgi:hypothetical protein